MFYTIVTRGYCKGCNIYFNLPDRGGKIFCPQCSKQGARKSVNKNTPLYNTEKIRGLQSPLYPDCRVDALHVNNERWSDAMGINPNQIPEFNKKFPWMKFNREGQCRVSSRHDKLKIMKARGMVENG